MNKTEQRYAMELDLAVKAGHFVWWEYEPIRLKLAPQTTYTPDFLVLNTDRTLDFHEIKGSHWEDDARAKFKIAVEKYWMFGFKVVQFTKDGVKIEDFR